MTNPRNIADFTGIGGRYVTYQYDSTIVYDSTKVGGATQVGLAVTQTGEAAKVVSLVGDGERVVGKLLKVESDGFCLVQVEGYCDLPGGSGATLTQGAGFVGALGAASAEGYIKAANTAGVTRGEIVDATDTAAVMVNLG